MAAHRTSPGALLGDPATVHGGVGLAVPGGEPSPGAHLGWSREAGHVAEFGGEHRGQHRTDATDLLDDPVAGIRGELPADESVEGSDLGFDRIQNAERGKAVLHVD
jgi:hypothetical protein